MSKKVNKTAIGAFVLGAVVLLVATVLVLGAGKFFTTEHVYITYFEGSVKGLNVGSPVTFRGVKVGEVKDISLVFDPKTKSLFIPVVFTLEPSKFKGTAVAFQREAKTIEKAVAEAGLRTQLATQSFVTGQLMLSLDFFPDKPAHFVHLQKKYPEIPSIPTTLEELEKTLENLPLKEMVDNLNKTLDSVSELVNTLQTNKTMESLAAAIKDTQALMQNLNSRVGPIADRLDRVAHSADAALVVTKKTMVNFNEGISDVLKEVQITLDSTQTVLKQSEQTLAAYGEDSRLNENLNQSMRELTATMRSLRQLSDYLEQHPESLLKGKAAQ
ncbi:MAG: MlaD family protein [Desulfuromonadales bacterium]|jgi:paraquat-inducible protein B